LRLRETLTLGLLLMLPACPGRLANPERFTGGGTDAGVGDVPQFLVQNCGTATACHAAGAPTIDLASPGVADRIKSYTLKHPGCTPSALYDAADPANSMFIKSLRHTTNCGLEMPLGVQLPAAQIDAISAWLVAQ
jgi:hypothetical protein